MANSKYCLFVILITQIPTAFIQGVSLVALNSAAPAVEVFIKQSYQKRFSVSMEDDVAKLILTLAQSSMIWGCVVGALSVNPILRHVSPTRGIFCAHVVNIVSVALSGPVAYFSASYEALIIGRIFTGIARGLGFVISMIIVAETSCRERLGFFQTPFQLIISFSAALALGLGHRQVWGKPELWPLILSVSAVTSIVYLCCSPWIIETPVTYLRRGNQEKAISTLKKLRTNESDVEVECSTLTREVQEESRRKPISIKKIIKSPHLRLQMITAITVMCSGQLAGSQGMAMYSDAVLLRAGVDPSYVTFASIGIMLQMVLSFSAFYFLEKKFGTKKVFTIGCVVTTIGTLIFTISNGLFDQFQWMSNLAILGLFVVMFGLQLGPILAIHSLPSELTTAASRPTVGFYSGVCFWTMGAITAFVFPYSVDAFGVYAYVPYVVFDFLLIIFAIFIIPETCRRTNEQIQKSFSRKSMSSISEIFSIGNRSSYPAKTSRINSSFSPDQS